MIEVKSAIGGCVKCGYSKCIESLDFHHKNPNEKSFTIGRLRKGAEETLQKEIDKCVCLCANCHREFHHLEKMGLTLEDYLV